MSLAIFDLDKTLVYGPLCKLPMMVRHMRQPKSRHAGEFVSFGHELVGVR